MSIKNHRKINQSRRLPASGVHLEENGSAIVLVTACTRNRARWLASREVHDGLVDVWRRASHWLVGHYVILPDHVHFFASPGSIEPESTLEAWARYWKSQLTRQLGNRGSERRWLPGIWDTRLRKEDGYESAWQYVRANPVRHGLAAEADGWEYQGKIHDLA